jgi:hypothetical protein
MALIKTLFEVGITVMQNNLHCNYSIVVAASCKADAKIAGTKFLIESESLEGCEIVSSIACLTGKYNSAVRVVIC